MKKLWKHWYFLPLLFVIIAWCYVNLKQFFIEQGYVYNPPIVPILEIQPYEQK